MLPLSLSKSFIRGLVSWLKHGRQHDGRHTTLSSWGVLLAATGFLVLKQGQPQEAPHMKLFYTCHKGTDSTYYMSQTHNFEKLSVIHPQQLWSGAVMQGPEEFCSIVFLCRARLESALKACSDGLGPFLRTNWRIVERCFQSCRG